MHQYSCRYIVLQYLAKSWTKINVVTYNWGEIRIDFPNVQTVRKPREICLGLFTKSTTGHSWREMDDTTACTAPSVFGSWNSALKREYTYTHLLACFIKLVISKTKIFQLIDYLRNDVAQL